VKENQAHVLDMETVTVMDLVLVLLDGLMLLQILNHQEQFVIVQPNVLLIVQTMEHVNVEFVIAILSLNSSLIAHAKTVLNHVLPLKCVHVMDSVLVYLDYLDLTVQPRLIVDQ